MSDNSKQQRYLEISRQITEQVGGKENIVASTHCATRLRIVLKDYDKINKEAIDNIDLVKGEFVAGNQLQIIFGAGLVNEIYEVFSQYTGTSGSSMAEVKSEAAKKMNPLQAVIKSLSDVFVDIMPGILAAALLSGLTGVLNQWDVVEGNAFMGIVSHPKMYTYYLNSDNQQLFKKIGIVPITNLFNYGNIETAKTFVKGISLCLPNDTTAMFDIEQLAAIGVFADYLSKHSGKLAYNDCYPASKTGQNSEEFVNGTTRYFKVLKAVGDPSTFVTLPGGQNEYYCFNYQNQACIQSLSFVKADLIDNEQIIRQAIKGIADATSKVIK